MHFCLQDHLSVGDGGDPHCLGACIYSDYGFLCVVRRYKQASLLCGEVIDAQPFLIRRYAHIEKFGRAYYNLKGVTAFEIAVEIALTIKVC